MDDCSILELDQQHLWHPCSQMKDYEQFKPLIVQSARGSHITLSDGQVIIDAISSWWCKSLGHNHPVLKEALLEQLERFEHVILANTTNDVITQLSIKLASLMPGLDKVFYAGDGSCAIEIAMKMSIHSRVIKGEAHKTKFIALKNGYHGETSSALSVSDLGLYRDAYESLLFTPVFVEVPYVTGRQDLLWHNAEAYWLRTEVILAPLAKTTTAIMVEPLLQGAGGMLVYSADFLRRLARWAKQHNVHLIADEIMTGIGRTGKMLACEYADVVPDFVCISKGLTSGWMSFSAVLTSDDMYQLFYDDYATGKAFLHSHTYTGNALAARVALATLQVMEEESLCDRAQALESIMRQHMEEIAEKTGRLKNIRSLGAMVAADLVDDTPRLGYRVYQKAVQLGALLRPLGNTIYWLPPLTITEEVLMQLKAITQQAVELDI